MSESHSTKPRYDTGELVAVKIHGKGNRIGEVQPSTQFSATLGEMVYDVRFGGASGSIVFPFRESSLRRPTRPEYWWHRNPSKGYYQVGRTHWFEWIGQVVASLLVIWAAFALLDVKEPVERFGRIPLLFIAVARILTLIMGVEGNYKMDVTRYEKTV